MNACSFMTGGGRGCPAAGLIKTLRVEPLLPFPLGSCAGEGPLLVLRRRFSWKSEDERCSRRFLAVWLAVAPFDKVIK